MMPTTPPVTQINYPLPYETWADQINQATNHMHQGWLQKVVLSRMCELRFAEHVPITKALAYLDEHYAGCYRFLFEPRPFHAFYGATPELLACVDGPQLRTMGLAGSMPRGHTLAEDEAIAQELQDDPKNRIEHQVVVDMVRPVIVFRQEATVVNARTEAADQDIRAGDAMLLDQGQR